MTAHETIRAKEPMGRCHGCGKTYGEAAWRSLDVSERIEAPEIRRRVSPWPEGLAIEVRRCICGRTIAAKRLV
jgi:hypothetical protein